MGNMSELRKQNRAWGSQEWPGVMRCERERGKEEKEMNTLQIPNNPAYLSFQQRSANRE